MKRLEPGRDGVVAVIEIGRIRYKVAECARCGRLRKIRGRGLCNGCIGSTRKNGTITEYGWTAGDRLEEYARHRKSMSIAEAAAATGVTRRSGDRYERLLRER